MNNTYIKIIELAVFHSYFDDGKVKQLDIKPSPQTQQLFAKQELLFNNNQNRFTIYNSGDSTTNDLLNYLIDTVEVEYFEFDVFSHDSNFYNYTDFPLTWIGVIEYSNKEDDNTSDVSTMNLAPQQSQNMATTKLGNIKFYLKDLISQLSNDIVNFNINFEARKTQWNYNIISQKTIEGLSIDTKSELSFDGPTEVELLDGSKALKFSTGQNLIALREKSDFKLDLIQKQNIRETTEILISGLPLPDANKINLVELEGRKVASSDMYIYI